MKTEITPPVDMIVKIGSDTAPNFLHSGKHYFYQFLNHNLITQNSRVLDVGCGVGRLAIPLTEYFSTGSYEGFDVDDKAILWCKENITPHHPNFNFNVAEIHNDFYNSSYNTAACKYKFPYNDNEFDFVFLLSVFTHMMLDDISTYLSEISRVLKPNGNCFITYFILNDESKSLIPSVKNTQQFLYPIKNGLTINYDTPSSGCAFSEEDILKLYENNNLKLTNPIFYGRWCGRENCFDYQDVIIAKKCELV